jgi:hypothetical protein
MHFSSFKEVQDAVGNIDKEDEDSIVEYVASILSHPILVLPNMVHEYDVIVSLHFCETTHA